MVLRHKQDPQWLRGLGNLVILLVIGVAGAALVVA
jgi:hypothetical protein